MMNKNFARQDEIFLVACKLARPENPTELMTRRQASKFRNNKGIAFKFKNQAIQMLKNSKKGGDI